MLTLPLALALSPLASSWDDRIGWTYVLVHSLLFYVFAISFWYASLANIQGWLSSALRALGPVIAAPIAWLFFGERLSPVQLIGAALVLTTSGLISAVERRNSRARAPARAT